MTTRDEARAARIALGEAARMEKSARIAEAVLSWDAFIRAGTVMSYASVGAEVRTDGLLAATCAENKWLLLPRCLGDGMMEAAEVRGLAECVPGALRILEPPPDVPAVPAEAIDLILVPGLLFDRRGSRIGQGAGYYDRFLAGYAGQTCGLAFAAQVVPRLVTHPHDVPVRALATEDGLTVLAPSARR